MASRFIIFRARATGSKKTDGPLLHTTSGFPDPVPGSPNPVAPGFRFIQISPVPYSSPVMLLNTVGIILTLKEAGIPELPRHIQELLLPRQSQPSFRPKFSDGEPDSGKGISHAIPVSHSIQRNPGIISSF